MKAKKRKRKKHHSILNKLNMLNNKFIFSITTLIRFLDLKQKYKANPKHENEEKGVNL